MASAPIVRSRLVASRCVFRQPHGYIHYEPMLPEERMGSASDAYGTVSVFMPNHINWVEDWCSYPACETKVQYSKWNGPAISLETANAFGNDGLDDYQHYHQRMESLIRCADGATVPWNFGCPTTIQLIVALPGVDDARQLLHSFDLDVCTNSFDGRSLEIANWSGCHRRSATVAPFFSRILSACHRIKSVIRDRDYQERDSTSAPASDFDGIVLSDAEQELVGVMLAHGSHRVQRYIKVLCNRLQKYQSRGFSIALSDGNSAAPLLNLLQFYSFWPGPRDLNAMIAASLPRAAEHP
jgi:hypothetical protein